MKCIGGESIGCVWMLTAQGFMMGMKVACQVWNFHVGSEDESGQVSMDLEWVDWNAQSNIPSQMADTATVTGNANVRPHISVPGNANVRPHISVPCRKEDGVWQLGVGLVKYRDRHSFGMHLRRWFLVERGIYNVGSINPPMQVYYHKPFDLHPSQSSRGAPTSCMIPAVFGWHWVRQWGKMTKETPRETPHHHGSWWRAALWCPRLALLWGWLQ